MIILKNVDYFKIKIKSQNRIYRIRIKESQEEDVEKSYFIICKNKWKNGEKRHKGVI